MVNRDEILELASSFEFERDDRRPPDGLRKGRFTKGWNDASEGQVYTEETLATLTWTNLGYRFGEALRQRSDAEVAETYQILAANFPIEEQFHQAMEGIYTKIGRAAGYWPSYFLRSVRRRGGLKTAKGLLANKKGISDGFRRLIQANRADLTVESLVLEPSFAPLFTEQEQETARERLSALPSEAFPKHKSPETIYPETLPPDEGYEEGNVERVLVNRYERSPRARAACLRHHGLRCSVCEMSFEETYGDLGKGFIHVHHRSPINLKTKDYRVEAKRDLIPVCPNCHAMLHRDEPPMEVEDLKSQLQRHQNN